MQAEMLFGHCLLVYHNDLQPKSKMAEICHATYELHFKAVSEELSSCTACSHGDKCVSVLLI